MGIRMLAAATTTPGQTHRHHGNLVPVPRKHLRRQGQALSFSFLEICQAKDRTSIRITQACQKLDPGFSRVDLNFNESLWPMAHGLTGEFTTMCVD